MAHPPQIDVSYLFDHYEALLIDAYGVLVHTNGPFAGASAFMQRVQRSDLSYAIITNDASRLPQSCARKYHRDGIDVPPEKIVTSASLLADYFDENDLHGARCLVLGPPDSHTYAERAGGELVDLDAGDFDALIIGDESGFEFIPTLDRTLTIIFRKLDAGEPVELIVPNPDLIYQRSETSFGFTSGSVAEMIERAIQTRYPGSQATFARLGKPYAPMFEQAVAQVGTRNCAVLGDQLDTDIRGANDYGLDSVLVATGLTDTDSILEHSGVRPDYILPSLEAAE